MDYTKYVIVKLPFQIRATAILFHPCLQHSSFIKIYDIISAGFCYLNKEGRIEVLGNSGSLGLKSKLEDSKIIEETLKLNS